MGLTGKSTGSNVLNENIEKMKSKCKYRVAIARKSECWKIHNI